MGLNSSQEVGGSNPSWAIRIKDKTMGTDTYSLGSLTWDDSDNIAILQDLQEERNKLMKDFMEEEKKVVEMENKIWEETFRNIMMKNIKCV